MTMTPKALAARDQIAAAIRDRFDRRGVSLHDLQDRTVILAVIGMIADAAVAWKDHEDDSPERRILSISYVLEAIVGLVEET